MFDSRAAICGATRKALAAIVRLGLIAPLRGMNEASTTYRSSTSCIRQSRSSTLEARSSPNLQVPQGCPYATDKSAPVLTPANPKILEVER
jgi:hypothetical protein